MNEKSLVIAAAPPRRTQRELSEKAAALKAKNAKKAAGGPPRLLSKIEVCNAVGKTFATLWQWMRDGKFPRARDLHGATVWFETEIDDFLAARPVKKYLGDAEHAPEPWRRMSPGRYGKARRAKKSAVPTK